jgi:hypothetical protein
MRTSETITKLAEALAAAQGELQNAEKDEKNPHYGNQYASLAMVSNTLRGPFAKHGLSLVQMPEYINGDVVLTTRLLHSSGEWMESEYPIRPTKPDPQGYGSAITYARRYCSMAVAGIAPEDDDGNEASRPTPQPSRQQPQPKQKPWTTKAQMIECFHSLSRQFETEGQLDAYQETLKKHGVQDVRMFADGSVAAKCYLELQDLLKPARNGRGLH